MDKNNNNGNGDFKRQIGSTLISLVPALVIAFITAFVAIKVAEVRISHLEKDLINHKIEMKAYVNEKIINQEKLRNAELQSIRDLTQNILQRLSEIHNQSGINSLFYYPITYDRFTDGSTYDYYYYSDTLYVFSDAFEDFDTTYSIRSSKSVYKVMILCPKDSEFYQELYRNDLQSNILINLGAIEKNINCIYPDP